MRASRSYTKTRWAVLTTAALLGSGGAVMATGAAGDAVDASPEIVDAGSPRTGSVDREQAATIGELRRARRAGDELPDRFVTALNDAERRGQHWGASPGLARQTAPGVWMVPGNRYVCLITSSPGDGTASFSCASNGDVARGRLAPSSVDATGRGVVTGVVPDGVDAVAVVNRDGSSRSVAVDRNTYRAAIDGDLLEVRFTDAAGTRHVLPMAWSG